MNDEEIYKICMICSTVYEGDLTKYYKDSQLSHGICNKYKCKLDYIKNTFQTDNEGAKIILGDLEKRIETE